MPSCGILSVTDAILNPMNNIGTWTSPTPYLCYFYLKTWSTRSLCCDYLHRLDSCCACCLKVSTSGADIESCLKNKREKMGTIHEGLSCRIYSKLCSLIWIDNDTEYQLYIWDVSRFVFDTFSRKNTFVSLYIKTKYVYCIVSVSSSIRQQNPLSNTLRLLFLAATNVSDFDI